MQAFRYWYSRDLSGFFFEKIFFLSLYRINFIMNGLGQLLLLLFLLIRCVRSRSLCVISISNFSLKISRARSSVFSWFLSVIPWIRKQFRLEYCSCQPTYSVIPLSSSFKEESSSRSSSITFFCSCLSLSNSSNLSDIDFIDSLRSAYCFSPLHRLLLLESAKLWTFFTFFSKFRKQFSKIFTQSSDSRLSSKTSPSVLSVSNMDTLGLSDELSSLCHLASSSVFKLFLKSLFLLLKKFFTSIFDNSYYLNTNV